MALDASAFSGSKGIYSKEIIRVLKLIIHCHGEILSKEKLSDNLENYLRNVLVKYMRANKELYDVQYIFFDVESGELTLDDKLIGFLDVKAFNLGDKEVANEDEYFSFECKRLDGSSESSKKYVQNGIKRYISGKYSSKMPLASMIGFVQGGSVDVNVKLINIQLRPDKNTYTIQELEEIELVDDFEGSFLSIHKRTNSSLIDLYHLMLLFPLIPKAG